MNGGWHHWMGATTHPTQLGEIGVMPEPLCVDAKTGCLRLAAKATCCDFYANVGEMLFHLKGAMPAHPRGLSTVCLPSFADDGFMNSHSVRRSCQDMLCGRELRLAAGGQTPLAAMGSSQVVVTDLKLAKLMRAAMFPGQHVEERATLSMEGSPPY
ncbi:hypothetical protein ABBQ38_012218 [Trebouxia sp. C0009 RCD-2024]